jgi:L-alanine-DL-glutamate epimerase-like enolase superfamily enzyme
MKITSIECYLGSGALGGFVTLKVNTDEGISGFGEAGLAYGNCSEAAFGQCQDFAKLVIGFDPFDTEKNLGALAPPHLLGHGRRRSRHLRHGGHRHRLLGYQG